MKQLSKNRIGLVQFITGPQSQLLQTINSRERNHTVCIGFLNPHVYNQIKTDYSVKSFLEKCQFVALDGIGVSIPACLFNFRYLPRIPMDNMFDQIVNQNLLKGKALVIGLSENENSAACTNISNTCISLSITGINGFYSNEEYVKKFEEHKDADFVLVGMGSPRSEQILLIASAFCKNAICWHVGGGTLRNWAGTKNRTPKIISKIGFGWMHRIIFEPETRNRYSLGMLQYLKSIFCDTMTREK